MSYLVFIMACTLLLAMLLHFRYQFRKTAHVRQTLQEARISRSLIGLHDLRRKDH